VADRFCVFLFWRGYAATHKNQQQKNVQDMLHVQRCFKDQTSETNACWQQNDMCLEKDTMIFPEG
jgi:hypothetical protein